MSKKVQEYLTDCEKVVCSVCKGTGFVESRFEWFKPKFTGTCDICGGVGFRFKTNLGFIADTRRYQESIIYKD